MENPINNLTIYSFNIILCIDYYNELFSIIVLGRIQKIVEENKGEIKSSWKKHFEC